jgi:hypothetical protein
MSVARATSRPGRRARLACRDSTITRWLSWKSAWIRRQSASASESTGAADPEDLEHAPDALLDQAGVAGVAPQLALGVGLVDDLPVPGTVGDGRLVLVALEA